MTYSLRRAELDDVPRIQSLIEESARNLAIEDYSAAQVEGALQAAWGVDTQLIEDGTYFVVEDAGDPVACGGWSFRATLFGNDREAARDARRLDPKTDAAKIRAFFVKSSHARNGIGSLLMSWCEAQARAKGFRYMELMATLPGLKLYTRHGFSAGDPLEYVLDGDLTLTLVPMRKSI